MKKYFFGILLCGLTGCGLPKTASDFNVDEALGYCASQVKIDASIVYADYYYLEALLRLKDLHRQ